jgi:hypothetical protein
VCRALHSAKALPTVYWHLPRVGKAWISCSVLNVPRSLLHLILGH